MRNTGNRLFNILSNTRDMDIIIKIAITDDKIILYIGTRHTRDSCRITFVIEKCQIIFELYTEEKVLRVQQTCNFMHYYYYYSL